MQFATKHIHGTIDLFGSWLSEDLLACLATAAPAFEALSLTSAPLGTFWLAMESPASTNPIHNVRQQ